LIVAVLGQRGRHARAAVGVASLPVQAAVEVDALIWLRT
jgi:enamine deaminase RidA (YjgF/YER057c/UK114 family)